MNPTRTSAPSSIVFSPHVSHFNFKPVIIQLLPFSHGLDLENPYQLKNAQNWDTTGTYEAPSKTQPHTSSGGMYNLREDHDLQAKFASLARKVEALELKKSGQLKYV